MNSKLTLSISKAVTDKAKKYARKKRTSLSKLVENQLAKLTTMDKEDEISPLVKSISGVITLKKAGNYKKGYTNFLKNKYK
jgi:hypothetical protein